MHTERDLIGPRLSAPTRSSQRIAPLVWQPIAFGGHTHMTWWPSGLRGLIDGGLKAGDVVLLDCDLWAHGSHHTWIDAVWAGIAHRPAGVRVLLQTRHVDRAYTWMCQRVDRDADIARASVGHLGLPLLGPVVGDPDIWVGAIASNAAEVETSLSHLSWLSERGHTTWLHLSPLSSSLRSLGKHWVETGASGSAGVRLIVASGDDSDSPMPVATHPEWVMEIEEDCARTHGRVQMHWTGWGRWVPSSETPWPAEAHATVRLDGSMVPMPSHSWRHIPHSGEVSLLALPEGHRLRSVGGIHLNPAHVHLAPSAAHGVPSAGVSGGAA